MGSPQMHILIVEDCEDDRIMYTQYLTRQGYRTSVARDGEEALEKAWELQPHLILMDLWLPMVSGWDVIKRLRADEISRHIPILVITGNTSVRPPDCDGWLSKPCLVDQLGEEIDRVLKARGKSQGLSPQPDEERTPEN